MIDAVDKQIMDWAAGIVGAGDTASVTLGPPTAGGSGRGVSLYLMECVSDPPLRGIKRAPLQITLRYVVTTWAPDPADAHRLLGELIFAAMDNTGFEVDLTPLPPSTWLAFGVMPQPSFVLAIPLKQERAEPAARYVRMPLVVETTPLSALYGTVLGPGSVPLAGAKVRLDELNLVEQTDRAGRFRFVSVPGGDSTIKLRVRAKGREMVYVVDKQSTSPLTIQFDSLDSQEG
ncbi:MAG: carboxypeptidase-like regulatory domain-containing protein [Chloroflexota bacterium]